MTPEPGGTAPLQTVLLALEARHAELEFAQVGPHLDAAERAMADIRRWVARLDKPASSEAAARGRRVALERDIAAEEAEERELDAKADDDSLSPRVQLAFARLLQSCLERRRVWLMLRRDAVADEIAAIVGEHEGRAA